MTLSPAEIRREVRSWVLGPERPNERYHDSVNKRLDGTCDWILERKEFTEWASGNPDTRRLLWIHGHAGFGKTILCARIVEHLAPTLPIAHFFFSSNFTSQDDMYTALRSWVAQLMSQSEKAYNVVYEKWDDDPVASHVVLSQVLRDILRAVPETILIFDGLDECIRHNERETPISDFLRVVGGMVANDGRVLIVSRDEPEIRQALTEEVGEMTEVKIQPQDVKVDTAALSLSILNKRLPNKGQNVRDSLAATMTEQCDGQFLWLVMQGASLRKGMTTNQLQRTLHDTTTGIDSLYDGKWDRITSLAERDRERVVSLLRWVTFSLRPLNVHEISEALLINEDFDEFPRDDVPDSDGMEDYIESEILGFCAPLVEIRTHEKALDPGEHTVQLAHFTVKQYLANRLPVGFLGLNERLRVSNEHMQNAMLGKLCLRYIRSRLVWGEGDKSTDSSFKALFRRYASESWHTHLKAIPEVLLDGKSSIFNSWTEYCEDIWALVKDFMDEQHSCWSPWKAWSDRQAAEKDNLESWEEASGPLYYAVKCDFTALAMHMIRANPETATEAGLALNLACEKGNIELMDAILNTGISIETSGFKKRTPLFSAVLGGQLEVAKVLISKGADATATNRYGRTILHTAIFSEVSSEQRLKTVKLLLDNGADTNIADDGLWRPVHVAVRKNDIPVLKMLVDQGADLSITDAYGHTLAFLTANNGLTDMLSFLIKQGVDFQSVAPDGVTPMGAAIFNGHTETVKLLQQHGVDLRTQKSSFFLAVRYRHQTMVEFLLRHGVAANVADDHGQSLLYLAAGDGLFAMVKLLIEKGANVDQASHTGMTPLMIAALSGHLEVVELLLMQGASVSVSDYDGLTALHFAVSENYLTVVELLVRHGAKVVDLMTRETPFNLLAERGFSDMIMLLLDFLEEEDAAQSASYGYSALLCASLHGQERLVSLLLTEKKIRPDTQTPSNSTPLFGAVRRNHAGIAAYLLAADMSSLQNEVDENGKTPLHYAALFGHYEVVHVLLDDPRVQVGAKDRLGETAFSIATQYEESKIAARLFVASPEDVDLSPGPTGRTLLHTASWYGFAELVQCILKDDRVQVNSMDHYGNTPLLGAVRNGHIDTVAVLLAADPTCLDLLDGSNHPLMWWAHGSVKPEIFALLQEHNSSRGLSSAHLRFPIGIKVRDEEVSSASSRFFCDVCTLPVPDGTIRYHCEHCDGGNFDFCTRCYNLGFRCLDSSHLLKEVVMDRL